MEVDKPKPKPVSSDSEDGDYIDDTVNPDDFVAPRRGGKKNTKQAATQKVGSNGFYLVFARDVIDTYQIEISIFLHFRLSYRQNPQILKKSFIKM